MRSVNALPFADDVSFVRSVDDHAFSNPRHDPLTESRLLLLPLLPLPLPLPLLVLLFTLLVDDGVSLPMDTDGTDLLCCAAEDSDELDVDW